MDSPGPSGTQSTSTSTPVRSWNRRPSDYFSGICTPMVMKKTPKKTRVPPTPVVDITYEEISEVPLPPNITVEEGEITNTSSENLSVLFVGQVQSPIANRTVIS